MCCLYIVATLLSPPRYCFGTGDLGSLRECRKQSRAGRFLLFGRHEVDSVLPQFALDSFKSLGNHIVSQTCALDLGGSSGGEVETGLYSIGTGILLEVCEKPERVTDRYLLF